MICHDLKTRSYSLGHCAHIANLLVRVRTPLCHLDYTSHNCCPWPKGVSWTWTELTCEVIITVHLPLIGVRVMIPLYCHAGSGYYTQLLSKVPGFVVTFDQGHISKDKVTHTPTVWVFFTSSDFVVFKGFYKFWNAYRDEYELDMS